MTTNVAGLGGFQGAARQHLASPLGTGNKRRVQFVSPPKCNVPSSNSPGKQGRCFGEHGAQRVFAQGLGTGMFCMHRPGLFDGSGSSSSETLASTPGVGAKSADAWMGSPVKLPVRGSTPNPTHSGYTASSDVVDVPSDLVAVTYGAIDENTAQPSDSNGGHNITVGANPASKKAQRGNGRPHEARLSLARTTAMVWYGMVWYGQAIAMVARVLAGKTTKQMRHNTKVNHWPPPF